MSRNSNAHSYDYISACSSAATHPQRFSLAVRQQPIQTRTSTNNERDRRAIDPPPIVQISLNNATPNETLGFLQNPYYFMCANLAHPTNDNEIYTPNHNALSGQTVSSMYKLKDIDNNDGGFFVLGDLSVKVEGQFRLKLTLFEITLTGAVSLKSIFTDVFTVYSAKHFPGVLDSTFLSRSFSDQGARIRIRKEHRNQITTTRKRKMSISSDEYHHQHHRPSPPKSQPSTPSLAAPTVAAAVASVNAPIVVHDNTTTSPRMYAASPTDAYMSYQRMRNTAASPADRRASLNSIGTDSTCTSEDRRSATTTATTPVSPPHQPYDKPDFHSFYGSGTVGVVASTDRSASPSIDTTTASATTVANMPSPPWMKHQPLSPHDRPTIRLPPLSQLISPEGGEQVDAAVAMMQLSQHTHQRPW